MVPSLFSATEKQFPQIRETCEEETFRLHLAIPHLVRAAEISMGEVVVQTNLVRTLSIMSENEECCRVLSEYASRLGILLGPIGKEYPDKSMGMLVRLGYVLGNVMANYDSARCQVIFEMNTTFKGLEFDFSFSTMTSLWITYLAPWKAVPTKIS